VLSTGGWQSWKPIPITDVSLKAGTQILRFEINTDYQSEIKNWLFSLNSIRIQVASSTGIENINSIPTEFALEQNYPNPFNPTTTIKYSIPAIQTPLLGGVGNGFVTLKIYDILGREIATLVNKEQKPGNYEVQFDATQLTSGVYFYKISIGNFISIKKMILMK